MSKRRIPIRSPSNAVPAAIDAIWPVDHWADVHVVLAVSGGADSMAMLRAILDLRSQANGHGELLVVHVHHGIRRSADADQDWLARQCEQLGVGLEVVPVDVTQHAAQQGDGIEASARTLRYEALRSVAERNGARYIATAHTQDDQVETVLHRILRGTGIDGLAGIPTFRSQCDSVTLVRPMLDVSRQQVLDYLRALDQPFLEDETNRDIAFTRNRIRYELLPHLREQYGESVPDAVLRISAQAAEMREVLDHGVEKFLRTAVRIDQHTITIDLTKASELPEPLLRHAIRIAWRRAGWPEQAMTDRHWRTTTQLIRPISDAPSISLPAGVTAKSFADRILLHRHA